MTFLQVQNYADSDFEKSNIYFWPDLFFKLKADAMEMLATSLPSDIPLPDNLEIEPLFKKDDLPVYTEHTPSPADSSTDRSGYAVVDRELDKLQTNSATDCKLVRLVNRLEKSAESKILSRTPKRPIAASSSSSLKTPRVKSPGRPAPTLTVSKTCSSNGVGKQAVTGGGGLSTSKSSAPPVASLDDDADDETPTMTCTSERETAEKGCSAGR